MTPRVCVLRIAGLAMIIGQLSLSPRAVNAGQYSVLHSFSNDVLSNAAAPQGGLTLVGSALFGTTHGPGRVYSINPDGSNFHVVNGMNAANADLTFSGSTLYGTTFGNGSFGVPSGDGSIFSLNTDGS